MKLLDLSKDYLPDRKVIDCANLRNFERKKNTYQYPSYNTVGYRKKKLRQSEPVIESTLNPRV